MQLSAAISHLQLGLSNLRAVIQDNPLGEAERRELREIGRDLQHLATVASERVALPCDASRPEIRTYELQEETFERSADVTCSIGLQLENQQSFKPSEHFTDVAVDKFPSIRSQQRSEISPKARSPRRASLDSRASEVSEAEESDADHGEDSTYTYSAASHISRGTENDDNFEEGGPGLHQALQNQREVLMGLFKRLDTDGSGVIDTEELQRALRSVGQHPARAQKLIAAADENCNGKVEIDEWKNVVNRLVAGKGSGALKVFASALMEHEYGKYGERIQHSSTWNWDETRCKPWRWFLSCHSSTRLAWDVLLLVLLCYIAVVLPFTLAYLTESGVHGYINVGIDVCFLFDIFLNFRTTYINEAGEEVRSNRLIAKNYLTSWFSLDLVTALPLEHLVDGVPGQVESVKLLRGSKIFKILKVIRAIKLIKIFRASELGSRVEDFVTHSSNGRRIFEACRILVSCCMLCHWLACFMPISGSGFLDEYEFKPESTTSQYISSLYWAMTTVTTVGYGDIIPTNDDERIFTMLAMIVGGAFYGYVVGNISVILASNDVNWRAQKERLELIEAWLTHHRFPTQLRRRIWAYYKQTVNSQVCWDDSTVFYELSSELREDVASFLIHPVLPRNLIFRGVPTSAMIRLVGILQQVTAKKRERIVPSDKFVMGMFLILDGGAVFERELEDIVAEGSEGRKKLTELLRNGDSFGEEVLLGLKNEYEYTVTASRKLVLLFVPRDRFIERLANMPEVFGIMRANFVG